MSYFPFGLLEEAARNTESFTGRPLVLITTSGAGQMRQYHLQQLREHLRVSRTDVSGLEITVVALQVAHQPARFGDQQASGGHVPRLEADFKEAVVAPGGGVGQVQRGGTGAAQAGSFLHQVAHDVQVSIEMFEPGVGKSCADQAVGEIKTLGDAQAPVVEVSAAPARGSEKLVLGRIVHHGLGDDAFVLQGDGYGILLEAVQEVGGAVQRVDDPDVFGVALGAALFSQDRMVRKGIQQGFDNGLLGCAIHFADVIGVRFLGDGEVVEVIGGAVDQVSGATRGLHRDSEHGVHGLP